MIVLFFIVIVLALFYILYLQHRVLDLKVENKYWRDVTITLQKENVAMFTKQLHEEANKRTL